MPKFRDRALFHGTTLRAWESIKAEGIRPLTFPGLIYLSETFEGAAQFTILTKRFEYVPNEFEVMIDDRGREVQVPKYVINDRILIVGVDRNDLDQRLLEEGFDHDPNFFRDRVLTYPETIDPDSFIRIWELDTADLKRREFIE